MPVVDLSAPIQQSPPELPELLRTDLRFADHAQGARDIEGLLGVPARLLRDGEGWAVEEFTRFGTHKWFEEGARFLIETHNPSGTWNGLSPHFDRSSCSC